MADGLLRIPQDRQTDVDTAGADLRRGSAVAPPNGPVPAVGLPVSALLVVAALAAALFGQGAYYSAGQRVVALLLSAAAIVALRSSRTSAVARRPVVRAAAAFAAWSVVSAALAGEPAAALPIVLILTSAVVVLTICERLDTQQRDQLAVAVVTLGVLVALTGWVGVAWHTTPWALEDQGLWRAATTLTYANAAAGFLATVALLSLARSARSPRAALGAGASCLLLVGLGATLSRGGLLAFLAGTLVLARLLGVARLLRSATPPALGALVGLAGIWAFIPASSPARPGYAAGALMLGVLVTVLVARLGPRPWPALALGGVLVLALVWSGSANGASRSIADVRLSVASPDRVEEARAALREGASRPLTGVGPGSAHLSWVQSDGAVLVARYAHNEYLQTFAELGVVGLSLLLILVAAIARTVGRCRPCQELRPVWAGVAAGLVALGVHGLFDFGWHLPAIGLTGALLVGIVTTSEREETE